MTSAELTAIARQLFGSSLPKPFVLVDAAFRVKAGEDPNAVARSVGTSKKKLLEVAAAADPVSHVLGMRPEDVSAVHLAKSRQILGQLLVGRAAELVFEDKYRRPKRKPMICQLVDQRGSRTDTDYRLLNGNSRPLYRINIKFHGTLFRQAVDLVGLQPEKLFRAGHLQDQAGA